MALINGWDAEVKAAAQQATDAANEVNAAKLTAFNGALTTDASGAAFATGDIYIDVTTGIIYRKD